MSPARRIDSPKGQQDAEKPVSFVSLRSDLSTYPKGTLVSSLAAALLGGLFVLPVWSYHGGRRHTLMVFRNRLEFSIN